MQQPIFAAIDVLEYPELHDESIPFFTFFRQLNKLFTASGVKDFALQVQQQPDVHTRSRIAAQDAEGRAVQDVSKPEPVRLRRHLSAIVNFTRYREDKLNSYIDSQDQLADVMDEAAQVSAERDELVRLVF